LKEIYLQQFFHDSIAGLELMSLVLLLRTYARREFGKEGISGFASKNGKWRGFIYMDFVLCAWFAAEAPWVEFVLC
jgi:hypothetical protein